MRALTALAFAAVVLHAAPGHAADHRDAPVLGLDTRADINDIYVFRPPTAPNNTVFIMTVNPVAGILSPDTFTPGVGYTIEIYHDDDFKPDVLFTVKFGPVVNGEQRVKIKSKGAPDPFRAEGPTGVELSLGSGGRFTAGLFDDPFFFDAVAFATNHIQPTGRDFYAGTNVNAFVIEVPTNALTSGGQTTIATRGVAKKGATDAVGRPLVSRFLLRDPSLRNAFNRTKLAKQDVFLAALTETFAQNYGPSTAAALADFFIPDVLPLDTTQPTAFFNGRKLEDDVVDTMLVQLTNALIESDGVDANDVAFRTVFPYLAPPH